MCMLKVSETNPIALAKDADKVVSMAASPDRDSNLMDASCNTNKTETIQKQAPFHCPLCRKVGIHFIIIIGV